MRVLCAGLIAVSMCVAGCQGQPSPNTGIATVTFASGALPAGTDIVIEKQTDAHTFAVFDDTASIYIPGSRAPYQVRVTTGTSKPAGPATVVLNIPSGFTAPPGYEIQAFGQIPQASDLEHYDAFEALPSMSDLKNGTVTATVSPAVFTSNRTGDGTYEAVLLLATVPVSSSSGQRDLVGTGNCPTGHIHTPILRNLHVRSPFDPNRVVVVDGQTYTGHFGTGGPVCGAHRQGLRLS